jgi:hypothetical protein
VFNREYQRRAASQALDRAGASLVRDDSGFYRPAKRTRPGVAVKDCKTSSNKLQGVQLELFAKTVQVVQDPSRPLFDLFPEAY